MQTICLRCGKFNLLLGHGRLRCSKCSFALTSQRYKKLTDYGSQIVLHGVKYRIEYENQIAKHGKIVRNYRLSDPTFVEATVAIIVSGVLGNAAYDAVKSTLSAIYKQLKKQRVKRRTGPSDRGLCTEDVDLVFKLIGNDDQFAERFIGYSRDYVRSGKSLTIAVRQACEEEFLSERFQDICRNDPLSFVFVTKTGKRFHRKNCTALRKPTYRMRIKAAILTPLVPCTKCKPF